MRTFFCFVLPPIAVLLYGKPISAVFNLVLTVCGWLPGVLHALFIANHHEHRKTVRYQTSQMARLIKR